MLTQTEFKLCDKQAETVLSSEYLSTSAERKGNFQNNGMHIINV